MKISAPLNAGVRRPVFSVLQTNTNAPNSTKLRINGNQGKFITRRLVVLVVEGKEPSIVSSGESNDPNERIGAIFTRAVM
ncbi:MAG: hypothetical protein JWR14_7141 [Caballeronia sp.]|nr:hypothetical protein [Caballeronia sp.]